MLVFDGSVGKPQDFEKLPNEAHLGGHPKPAIGGRLKTGQRNN
jgi:hypothetical protein